MELIDFILDLMMEQKFQLMEGKLQVSGELDHIQRDLEQLMERLANSMRCMFNISKSVAHINLLLIFQDQVYQKENLRLLKKDHQDNRVINW